jgi:hypothetical protein
MADRDVTIDVLASDKTGPAVKGAARNFDQLDKKVKDTDKAMKLLGNSSDTASAKVGAVSKKNISQLESIDKKISEITKSTRALGEEFNRTGNVHVFEKIANNNDNVKALKSLRKDLTSALEGGAQDAESIFEKFSNSASNALGETFTSLPPQAQAAAAAAVAIAGPVLVEGLSTAALLGIGSLGIVAGVVLASKDPAVAAAYGTLGSNISTQLQGDLVPFRNNLIDSADVLGAAFDKAEPGIKSTFAALSTVIEPLTKGLSGAATNALPGLEEAAKASLPLIRELASDLPRIGSEIGDLGTAFAQSGQGAQVFFQLLESNIEVDLELLTGLVKSVGTAGNIIAVVGAKLHLWHLDPAPVNAFGHAIGDTGDEARNAATDYAALDAQLSQVNQTADTVAGAITNKLLAGTLSLDQANLSVAKSLTAVTDSFKENGRQLDISTAKGQANRSAVLDEVSANIQQYNSLINAGVSAQDAAAAYDTNTAALERNLRKAGLTSGQVQDLIGKYKNVPDKVNTEIAINGLSEAINNLNQTLKLINNIHDKSVTISVATIYSSKGHPNIGEGGTIPNKAGGGFSAMSGWMAAQFAAQADFMAANSGQFNGGPREIDVNNNVTVSLDGQPFYAMTATTVRASEKRSAWREKTGRR